MTLTNPATRALRAAGAPLSAADIDINAAIVRYCAKLGHAALRDIEEVFLPVHANCADTQALQARLNHLVLVGRLQRIEGQRVAYLCLDREALAAPNPAYESRYE